MITTQNSWIITTILIFGFSACQKENQTDNSFGMTKTEFLNQTANRVSTEEAILVDANTTPVRRTLALLPALEEGGMEDVEEVISGQNVGESCIQAPHECAHNFGTPVIESVQPGRRVGFKTIQNLNEGFNNVSTYRLPNRTLINLNANEKTYKLKIRELGTYRVQLTPKYSDRDVDVFVYKLDYENGFITRTLVGAGIYGQGATETIDIQATSVGYYDLVVDAESTLLNNDFTLSVSNLTRIKTTTTSANNTQISYRFARIVSRLEFQDPNVQQIGWRFRKVGSSALPQTFAINAQLRFNCSNCDWLISPLFKNMVTNVQTEGTTEFFKP
jgi:hypothetical protein